MASIKAEDGDDEPSSRLEGYLSRLYVIRDLLLSTAFLPLRALMSKPAQKFYLGSILFTVTSLTLLFLSTVAFILFYWNYVPAISLERDVYLQFGNDHPPIGMTALPPSTLSSQQPYDITITLHLPRSPPNLAAGNFMLELQLLSFIPLPSSSSPPSSQPPAPQAPSSPSSSYLSSSSSYLSSSSSYLSSLLPPQSQELLLHHSRRPALLTYRSPLVSTAKTLLSLGLHVTGWTTESEIVEVKMFESVEFARGWRNVPSAVRVRIETLGSREVEIYGVAVKFGAKLGGLRYVLYTFPLTSALVFIGSFYVTSLTSTIFVYLVLAIFYSNSATTSTSSSSTPTRIKRRRSSDLSDTSRSFPTRSSHPPLHYQSQPPLTPKSEKDEEEEEQRGRRIKLEEDDEDARADVEDFSETEGDVSGALGEEDLLAWRDSGIGTGMESERLGVDGGRRRKSGRER